MSEQFKCEFAKQAEVTDEQIKEAYLAWCKTNGTPESFARAILALRPAAVPMDKQDAWDNSPVNSDWEAVDAYLQGIEDAETHHGITAQIKKEDT